MWTRNTLAAALATGLLLAPGPAMSLDFAVVNANLQKRVNGALAMMQYSVSPGDVTTSSLSLTSADAGTTQLRMAQLGGGLTWSRFFPLYLEGNAGYSRYDPVYVISSGTEQRSVPVDWNSLVGTVGVGWDFPIAPELVLRPIANFTLGHVASDIAVAGRLIGNETGKDLEFLKYGQLNAVGYGGSLMLDYEHHRANYEIDVEVRLTEIWLQSYGNTSEAVEGSSLTESIGLWSRWRAPTGLRALDRPVRYVLEYAFTHYFGPDGDMLPFNDINSVGGGLELDSGKYERMITRWRLMYRYKFGDNVRGYSVGLGISF